MKTMACEDCRQLLVEGERSGLGPAETAALATHLARCAACRAEQARLAELLQVLDSTGQPDAALEARVLGMAAPLLAARARRVRWQAWLAALRPRHPVLATCYSLVLLGSGVLTGQLLPPGSLGLPVAGGVAAEERLLQICPVGAPVQREV